MYLIHKGIWCLWAVPRICHNITLLIVLEEQKSIYDQWRAVLVQTTVPFSLTRNWENSYCSAELVSVTMKNFTWDHVAFYIFNHFGCSPELETCSCLPLGQAGGERWPRPCVREPQEHCTKARVSKYSVMEVWLQMQEHCHSTHSSCGGCIGITFTVLNDCFHAWFWKAWGFWYPRGFFWKLGCRLLHLVLYQVSQAQFDPLNSAFPRTLVLLRWSSQNWIPSLVFQVCACIFSAGRFD